MAVNLLPLFHWLLVYDCSGKLEPSSLPIRWQLTCYHFPIDSLFMIVPVNSSLFLNQSDATLKSITTWSPALSCGQFTCYHCLVNSLFMIGPKKSRLSLNQSGANFPALWAHYLLSLSLRLLVMSSWMFFSFSAQYIHRSLRWQRKTKIIHGSPANERKRAKKLIRRGIRKVSNPKFLFNWCLSCVEFSCTWAVRRFCLGHTQLRHWSRNVMSK